MTDEDGIDGPFERAMNRSIAADARKRRNRRPVGRAVVITADTITDAQINEIEDRLDRDGSDIATEDYRYTTPEVSYYCAVALGDIKGDDIRTARKLCAEIYNAVKADQ